MKRLTTIFLMLCFFSASATSWRLNNNPAVDADFTTFQAAHDAASAGDTIYVEGNGFENHYGEVFSITKKLVIIGPGYFLNENDSTYAFRTLAKVGSINIEPDAAGTEIHGMYIQTLNYSQTHVNIKASNVIFSRNRCLTTDVNNNHVKIISNADNVVISQNYIYAISVASGVTANNLLIANNYIENRIDLNNLSSGIFTNNVIRHGFVNVYNSQIKNNIIFATGHSDALSVNNAGNYIAYNLSSGSLVSGGNYGPGNVGNVDMSTVFVGYPTQGSYSTDGRWQLKAGSPAIGAGEGGIDCGMFGGSLPYVLSGQPAIPRIYEAIVPTAGSTVSGLPVIIKAKSQN